MQGCHLPADQDRLRMKPKRNHKGIVRKVKEAILRLAFGPNRISTGRRHASNGYAWRCPQAPGCKTPATCVTLSHGS